MCQHVHRIPLLFLNSDQIPVRLEDRHDEYSISSGTRVFSNLTDTVVRSLIVLYDE